jgi:hypothetical protein
MPGRPSGFDRSQSITLFSPSKEVTTSMGSSSKERQTSSPHHSVANQQSPTNQSTELSMNREERHALRKVDIGK